MVDGLVKDIEKMSKVDLQLRVLLLEYELRSERRLLESTRQTLHQAIEATETSHVIARLLVDERNRAVDELDHVRARVADAIAADPPPPPTLH